MVYLLIFFLAVLVSFFKPKFVFWFSVFMITNPGGVSHNLFLKGALGGVFYFDIFFVLIFVSYLFIKSPETHYASDKVVKNIFRILTVFVLYKIFIWGLLVPNYSLDYFIRYVLMRERDAILGFLILIPVYNVARQDLKYFTKIIIWGSTIILVLVLSSMLLGLEIIKVNRLERYIGSGIVRLYLDGYGLLNFLIPAAIVVSLAKLGFPQKRLLFLGGVLSVINILVTLTKNVYLGIILTIIASFYLTSKVFSIRITKSVFNFGIAVFVLALLANFFFPNYLDYGFRVFYDLILLASEGQTSDGDSSRAWQIPAFIYEFVRSPIFGTGHGYVQLSQQFSVDQFDATDFPLLAHIMQYGMLGISIYLLYYFKLFAVVRKGYKLLRSINSIEILMQIKYEVIWIIATIAFFVGYFGKIFMVFIELTRGTERVELTIYTALILASIQRIEIFLSTKVNVNES